LFLFKELGAVNKRIEFLENASESDRNRASIFKALNEQLHERLREEKERSKRLDEELRKHQRRETELTSERDVARRELEIAQRQAHELFQQNGVLNHQVVDGQNKRQRLRASFNELQRKLPRNLLENEELAEEMNTMRDSLKG